VRLCPVVLVVSQLLVGSNTAFAQKDSLSSPARRQVPASVWIVPIGITASVALDPELREWALRERSRSLNHISKSVSHLGRARVLVPAMALSYVAARLTDQESLAGGTLNTAAAYVASDLLESVLKPVIGRERPYVEGNSHRFRPFTARGDWHSLPSGHVAHIASIAEAIAEQTHSLPVSVISFTLVALVGWDRIYEDQHWASDVTATIALSSAVSGTTVRWLQSHRPH
jgi:membrane-associated phospholipid phosphatase